MNKETLEFNIDMLKKLPASLGTPEGPEFLRLDNASDIDYLLRLRKKANILKKLDLEKVENITLPTLNVHLENLRSKDETSPIELEEDKKGSQRFDIPEGKGIPARTSLFLKIIADNSEKTPISRDEIIEKMDSIRTNDPRESIKNLSRAIADARRVTKGTGLSVGVILGDIRKREPASYFLKKEGIIPEDQKVQQPTQVETPKAETLKILEWPEYGPLSRLDVSIIAKNFLYNQVKINEYLESKGVNPLENEVLKKLVDLTGNITLIPSSITDTKERSSRILEMREGAKRKVKELLLDPNFDTISEEIFDKDEDVWKLLVHLYELNEHLSQSKGTSGISNFFERLVLEPTVRDAVIDVRSGTVMAIIHKEEVPESKVLEPKPPIIITDETFIAKQLELVSQDIQDPTEEQKKFDREFAQLLAEEAAIGKKDNEENKKEVVAGSPSLWVPEDAEIKKKGYDVEKRDTKIREKLIGILKEWVLPYQDFNQPANNVTINRIIQRLKKSFMQKNEERDWVIPCEKNSHKDYRFDRPGIAALFYLSSLRQRDFDKLENSQRSEVQKVAEEVYEQAVKEFNKTS